MKCSVRGTCTVASPTRSGQATAILAGGAEELCFESFYGFERTGLLCATGDGLGECPIPFDARRNGFALGEGAALLMLEDAESAAARGASVLGEIKGHGSAYDLSHGTVSAQAVAAIAQSMRLALHDAQLDVDAIGCLSASANGSVLGDRHEAQAVAAIFGGRASALPVTAIKSMLGETLGASGAMQTVALLEARRQLQPADRARLAILFPPRAGQIATDDALDRHDLGLANEHRAAGQLGPVALQYGGSGTFVERDEAAGRLVLDAKGRDKRGNGTAGAHVTATFVEESPSSTNVQVVTESEGDETRIIVTATREEGESMNFANFVGRVVQPDLSARDVQLRQTGPGRYEGAFESGAPGTYMVNLRYDAPREGGGAESGTVEAIAGECGVKDTYEATYRMSDMPLLPVNPIDTPTPIPGVPTSSPTATSSLLVVSTPTIGQHDNATNTPRVIATNPPPQPTNPPNQPTKAPKPTQKPKPTKKP